MATELTTFEASTSEPVSPSAPQNGEPDAALIPENLPPMDRGRGAWMFCISACVLELLIWGFGFSFGVFQSWYTSNPPFDTQSPVAVTAVGASALGVQYFEGLLLMALLQMRPEWMRTIMWGCLVGCALCFVISSFTTQVPWLLLPFLMILGVAIDIGARCSLWDVCRNLVLPSSLLGISKVKAAVNFDSYTTGSTRSEVWQGASCGLAVVLAASFSRHWRVLSSIVSGINGPFEYGL
jgi:hypothetical protein